MNRILLFGDQTVDPCPIIKQLSRRSTESSTLKTFLQNSSDVLRQELCLSVSSERSAFPPFDSILGLAEAFSRGDSPEEAVTTVLLCIGQLGLLLA